MRAPILDLFSIVPEMMLAQSHYCDFAWFPTPQGEICLAFFARTAYVLPADGAEVAPNGLVAGIEIVAYPCDAEGRVFDWEQRYELSCTSGGTEPLRRLKLVMANGLVNLSNYEGLLAPLQNTGELDDFDWSSMPIQGSDDNA